MKRYLIRRGSDGFLYSGGNWYEARFIEPYAAYFSEEEAEDVLHSLPSNEFYEIIEVYFR